MALLGAWLHRRGWPAPLAAVSALATPLLVHGAVVAANFGLAARANRGDAAVPPAGLRPFLMEWRDSLALYWWWMSWGLGSAWPAAAAGAVRVPVLLVHGLGCNRGAWTPTARWLLARGHPCHAVSLEPPLADIDRLARTLGPAIERLHRATGRPVALVGHSMGGLVIRAHLQRHGWQGVAGAVTLGTPHGGTAHARLALGENVRQMRPGSAWLRHLGVAETPAERARFTCIRTLHDNIVAPQAAQVLPGARNVAVKGVGHVTLAWAPVALDALGEALDALGREDNAAR